MPSPFDVTTPSTVISLTDREGTATFTVRSVVRRKLTATAKFITDPVDSPSAKWLSFVLPNGTTSATDSSQTFDIDDTKQYQVKIVAPPEAKTGGYSFKLRVAEDTNPDDNFSESPSVTYTVPDGTKPPPIGLIIAIVAVVLVVVIAIVAAIVIKNTNDTHTHETETAVSNVNLTAAANQTATANALATQAAVANLTATALQQAAIETSAARIVQATQAALAREATSRAIEQQTAQAATAAAATQQARQTIISSGHLNIPQTFLADLDSGQVTQSGADIFFHAVSETERFLEPQTGVKLAVMGGIAPGFAGCAAAPLSTATIPISSIPAGTFVCVATNGGHLSQIHVTATVGPSPGTLSIDYITFRN